MEQTRRTKPHKNISRQALPVMSVAPMKRTNSGMSLISSVSSLPPLGRKRERRFSSEYEDTEDADWEDDVTKPRKRRRENLDHMTAAEKLARRKMKNREAAQTARDRKRIVHERMEMALQELQEKTTRLEAENERLRAANEVLLKIINGKNEPETKPTPVEKRTVPLKSVKTEFPPKSPIVSSTTAFESAALISDLPQRGQAEGKGPLGRHGEGKECRKEDEGNNQFNGNNDKIPSPLPIAIRSVLSLVLMLALSMRSSPEFSARCVQTARRLWREKRNRKQEMSSKLITSQETDSPSSPLTRLHVPLPPISFPPSPSGPVGSSFFPSPVSCPSSRGLLPQGVHQPNRPLPSLIPLSSSRACPSSHPNNHQPSAIPVLQE